MSNGSMPSDQQTYQRAAHAALLGLAVQAGLAVVVALTGLWAQSPALYAATWHVLGGLPLWVILWLIHNQHRVEVMEALEVEQLTRAQGQSSSIFQEQADELRVARQRLAGLYKWGLGIVSVFLALYLLGAGILSFVLQYRALAPAAGASPAEAWTSFTAQAMGARADAAPAALLVIGFAVAFVAFIVARYVAGMTSVRQWQLLRGGAGYLMGASAIGILVGIGGLVSWFRSDAVIAVLGLLVPGLMVLIGAEVALAFLLGAYRPRAPGEVPRPAFDSRLLGWLTKPESLGKIINETLNYQFGFEISRSWFYQLLARSIAPLAIVGAAVLFLASCVVLVPADEQAILLTLGQRGDRPADPGLHLKWPWPIGRAQRYPVGRIQQLHVGSYQRVKPDAAVLWTNQHAEGQEEFLITAPTPPPASGEGPATAPAGPAGASAPAVSLVAVQLTVQYRITDLMRHVVAAERPEAMLAAAADRCLAQYTSRHDIDTLLGAGRLTAAGELRREIQAAADRLGLGVGLGFVGLTGVHPPQAGEVAAAFHQQVGAIQEREKTVQKARQDAIQLLAGVAGSPEMAQRIAAAIRALERAREELARRRAQPGADAPGVARLAEEVARRTAEVEGLITQAPGKGSQAIYAARAERWQTPMAERGRAVSFEADNAADQAASRYFRARQYLDVLAETLPTPRKYVVGSQHSVPGVYRIDLKDAAGSLNIFNQPNP